MLLNGLRQFAAVFALLTVVISDVAKRSGGELLRYQKGGENKVSATSFFEAERESTLKPAIHLQANPHVWVLRGRG